LDATTFAAVAVTPARTLGDADEEFRRRLLGAGVVVDFGIVRTLGGAVGEFVGF